MKRKVKLNVVEQYNARLHAEHALLRASILAMRPDWDVQALEAVRAGYGDRANPGLYDILEACQVVDEMARRFTKAVST